jgi:pimeloyl-ACP methyl ester carboxylesterase
MIKRIILGALAFFVLVVLGAALYYHFTQETGDLDDEERKEIGGNFVKLSKGYVFYEWKGPDTGQTVILIHGAGSGCYAWDKNFDYLVKEGFHVLRYDLYGRGFSDRVYADYDTTLFYDQLLELIDTLHLKAPYNIAAVSMGATIAIHFTKNNLHKVKSLALIDPASLGDGTISKSLKLPVISPLLMTIYWYPRAVEKQMREYYRPETVPEYREKSWRQLKYKGLKRAILSTWVHMLPLNMMHSLETIGKSDVNVLLVWGKNDPLIPLSISALYKNAIPQSNYIEIDSAGHLSNYERPAAFNPAYLEFLKEVDKDSTDDHSRIQASKN